MGISKSLLAVLRNVVLDAMALYPCVDSFPDLFFTVLILVKQVDRFHPTETQGPTKYETCLKKSAIC